MKTIFFDITNTISKMELKDITAKMGALKKPHYKPTKSLQKNQKIHILKLPKGAFFITTSKLFISKLFIFCSFLLFNSFTIQTITLSKLFYFSSFQLLYSPIHVQNLRL